MYKLISTLILASLLNPAQAKTITCIGMDGTNNHKLVKVIADIKTEKLIINGDVFNTDGGHVGEGKSKSDYIFTTNFVNTDGVYVYDVFGVITKGTDKGKWFIFQKNATTHQLMSYINLSCSIEN